MKGLHRHAFCPVSWMRSIVSFICSHSTRKQSFTREQVRAINRMEWSPGNRRSLKPWWLWWWWWYWSPNYTLFCKCSQMHSLYVVLLSKHFNKIYPKPVCAIQRVISNKMSLRVEFGYFLIHCQCGLLLFFALLNSLLLFFFPRPLLFIL